MHRVVPLEVGFAQPVVNPALPASLKPKTSHAVGGAVQYTVGAGGERVYPELRSPPQDFGRPLRPFPGSIADFDRIMNNCEGDDGHVRLVPHISAMYASDLFPSTLGIV